MPDISNTLEPELLAGRRVFSAAQPLLSGRPITTPQSLSVGWHDTSVNPETGSFAVVQENAGLDDLVGEIVEVVFLTRTVYAYVLDVADVPTQLSLTRRLFLALTRLTVESLPCDVAVAG